MSVIRLQATKPTWRNPRKKIMGGEGIGRIVVCMECKVLVSIRNPVHLHHWLKEAPLQMSDFATTFFLLFRFRWKKVSIWPIFSHCLSTRVRLHSFPWLLDIAYNMHLILQSPWFFQRLSKQKCIVEIVEWAPAEETFILFQISLAMFFSNVALNMKFIPGLWVTTCFHEWGLRRSIDS